MVETSEISYFNELWCKNHEIKLIRDISAANKTVLFKSDMDDKYIKGRPFGGQAWIIEKSFEIIDHEFLSRHVSFVQLKKENKIFYIIGVYLPFDNPNKKEESLSQFELSLSLISVIIKKSLLSASPIFIIGDFNSDIYRKNRFDKILSEFITEENLCPLDILFTQKINYTFFTSNSNLNYISNIDHILFNQTKDNQIISKIQCNILEDVANMSDHNAISLEFVLDKCHFSEQNTEYHQNINFNNPKIYEFYKKIIDDTISQLESELLNLEIDLSIDLQLRIDKAYKLICNFLTLANNRTLEFQENFLRQNINNNYNNKKSWFTPELKEIKSKIMLLKHQLTYSFNPYSQSEIKQLKTKFRKIQRQNIYLLQIKELNKFETLAKEKNKTKFWRFINKSKKSRTNEKNVSIPPNLLFDHYSNFFNEKYNNLTPTQKEINTEIETHFKNYEKPNLIPIFSQENIEKIFFEMKHSNVKGNDLLSYSLLKHAQCQKLEKILLDFFNSFVINSKIPFKFNHTIIKPILKDQNKKSNDTNNIRPLSISNCLAQIFEKLILLNSPRLAKIHKNQFGFKKKTSCNHSIFVMKETVLKYTKNGSACKIASLDAEKAFDKVWRNGLFFKLKNKLNDTYWFLLKLYYDSSTGIILSKNLSTFAEFSINCGVKQGGILSPFLFNIFIDDLIKECTDLQIGALFYDLNVSILVYADDILLISPVDSHLQRLLNICSNYSEKWLIKFNPNKSGIICFGKAIFPETAFLLNKAPIKMVETIKYLGIVINNSFDFDLITREKFKNVQKSIFNLTYLGLTPKGVSPFLKSFLYKTYCLSTFTYALETTTLKAATRDFFNICQNNIIRQIIGLNKFSHISEILKILKLFTFEELYIGSKLSFLETIKNNELSYSIFNYLCLDIDNLKKNYNSFQNDILLLKSYFGIEIECILARPLELKKNLKTTFSEVYESTNLIHFYLSNLHIPLFKNKLNELLRPEFLQDYIEQMIFILN